MGFPKLLIESRPRGIEELQMNLQKEFHYVNRKLNIAITRIKERNAVYESLTYSSELYVSAGLIWKTSRDMQEQTILIGNIPLMNSLGTSIVNGIYRIVINQILQSPGIYYRSELDHNGISVYTGTIISDWGGRSELEIDRKASQIFQPILYIVFFVPCWNRTLIYYLLLVSY
ncbi:hypothetical protein CASFOL_007866 [Castilleja foliolosa]|uniref:DNA-directed RNA polymerase n=1 Tax=Castilleja foliolosa TaxID=1961234 RepID=A0ABD3E3V3_9LAMI